MIPRKPQNAFSLIFALFLLLGQVIHGHAQSQSNRLPSSVTQQIPKGYEVLESRKGDLNHDAYPDLMLVLHKPDEKETSDVIEHPTKRPLLLFKGTKDKNFQFIARNDNAVYCIDCGGQMGDPFTGITIKKGFFSVEHYGGSGWRWTRIITFKYSPNDQKWYLYKDGGESYHASDPEKVSEKVKTSRDFGKVAFSSFDIYKED